MASYLGGFGCGPTEQGQLNINRERELAIHQLDVIPVLHIHDGAEDLFVGIGGARSLDGINHGFGPARRDKRLKDGLVEIQEEMKKGRYQIFPFCCSEFF